MAMGTQAGFYYAMNGFDVIQFDINKGYYGALSGQGFYSYPNPEYLEPDFLK